MKNFRILALMLALALVFSGIAVSAEEAKLSEPGVYPIWTGDEPYTVTVLMAPNEYVTDFETNVYTQKIEALCNVNLDFVFLPAVDPGDKLNIMVSGGDSLPDVINFNLTPAQAKAYADAGALIDLKPFYDAGLGYNVDKPVAEHPEMNLLVNISTADGSVYGVPKIQVSPSNETRYKMWVNKGWLDNLGLTAPTTTEEFYNMLVAFKEQDANGNGDAADEIPFITSTG